MSLSVIRWWHWWFLSSGAPQSRRLPRLPDSSSSHSLSADEPSVLALHRTLQQKHTGVYCQQNTATKTTKTRVHCQQHSNQYTLVHCQQKMQPIHISALSAAQQPIHISALSAENATNTHKCTVSSTATNTH